MSKCLVQEIRIFWSTFLIMTFKKKVESTSHPVIWFRKKISELVFRIFWQRLKSMFFFNFFQTESPEETCCGGNFFQKTFIMQLLVHIPIFYCAIFPILAQCDRCCVIPNKVIHCYILFSKWIETEPKKMSLFKKTKL